MKKFLLADDHSFIRLGLIQILKDEYPSVEITEVSDGESLINEVIKQDWDLVISDIDMPEMNGYALIAALRADPVTRDLPVVALTGFGRAADARKALDAGLSTRIPPTSCAAK